MVSVIAGEGWAGQAGSAPRPSLAAGRRAGVPRRGGQVEGKQCSEKSASLPGPSVTVLAERTPWAPLWGQRGQVAPALGGSIPSRCPGPHGGRPGEHGLGCLGQEGLQSLISRSNHSACGTQTNPMKLDAGSRQGSRGWAAVS